MINFRQFNEAFLKIEVQDAGIDQELSEFFSFYVDGYKFMPAYRSGRFDGKIRIYDLRYKKLPKGLLKIAVRFCKDRGYTFNIDPELNPKTNEDEEQIEQFVKSIPITSKGRQLQYRDYQLDAIKQQIRYYRNLLISPTSSGKSAIAYAKVRWHIERGHKILLIVPTTQLVEQLYGDFADYSETDAEWNVEDNCQMLYSGKERIFNKNVMISTWQSLVAMSKNRQEEFMDIVQSTDVLILDEGHSYKSDVVLNMVNKFVGTKWRTGMTGTLDDSKINKLQLIGIMSEPYQVITTKQLMDQNSVVKLKIKMIKLTYPEWYKSQLKGMDYKVEINHLVTLDARNNFIAELTTKCKGVTLVLFTYVEKHGAVLYEKIRKLNPDRQVNFIHGGVDVDDREAVRQLADRDQDCIIIASASIFSTGTNIPAIENIVFAMPTKSTIRVRQQIGRGLRLRDGKNQCNLFDISDDLQTGTYTNTTLRHMFSRLEIYEKEQFEYQMQAVSMSSFLEDQTTDSSITNMFT